MLAVGRALLLNGSLVIMDEPSEGLAPTIVDVLVEAVHHLVAEGTAVLVVEQKLLAATAMAERQLVMVSGRIEAETTATELKDDPELQRRYLGVGSAVETREALRQRPRRVTTVTELVNVALIGSKFMGRAHSNAWLNVGKFFPVDPLPRMHTVVGRNASELADFARTWGWQHTSTDWRAAVESPEVGLVDIATPNDVHAEQAIAALEAGKHVVCEKPLAGTLADAERMADAAAAAAGRTFVWFNYRRVPAVALAQRLVASGALGRIYHARAAYLQSWGGPDTPLLWRFQGDIAGFRGPRGSQRAHHRHGPLRHRRGGRDGRGRHRAHVHHRTRDPGGLVGR